VDKNSEMSLSKMPSSRDHTKFLHTAPVVYAGC